MWETWVQSLGWEDPLEEEMATHSSILAWRISMDRRAWLGPWGHKELDTTERQTRATQEKTLESPLDCKEIKPVNPKGNQP